MKKEFLMFATGIPICIIILIVVALISMRNDIISKEETISQQWSEVENQLQRRYDLIPNLVATVKGYAKHEKETLNEVIEARNKAVNASTPEEEMESANVLTGALGKLFALAEAYPDLKANQNFLDLQANLKETEDKIAITRQFYNDTVTSYNTMLQLFPNVLFAGMFKFYEEKLFKSSEEEKINPRVQF